MTLYAVNARIIVEATSEDEAAVLADALLAEGLVLAPRRAGHVGATYTCLDKVEPAAVKS